MRVLTEQMETDNHNGCKYGDMVDISTTKRSRAAVLKTHSQDEALLKNDDCRRVAKNSLNKNKRDVSYRICVLSFVYSKLLFFYIVMVKHFLWLRLAV